MSSPTRNVCITAVDSLTGFLIANHILKEREFYKEIVSLTGLTLNPSSSRAAKLEELGTKCIEHVPGREQSLVKDLEEIGCDTICLVPPAHEDKFDLTMELISAAKKAGISNMLLISSAGADSATKEKQPRLREFIELEAAVLSVKGDPLVVSRHSPCVIRAGFYTEHLLHYSQRFQNEGLLPLPIGKDDKFAPVALVDVCALAAHVLAGQGKQGFDDRHCGQMMVVTGPLLCSGKELATAASKALGQDFEYEEISEAEARRILKAQSNVDASEMEYILEYYSLVREGKTNYIATMAFKYLTGVHPTDPNDYFQIFAEELRRILKELEKVKK